MQLIETVTVGSGGASSIEFASIPQDGTDLLLVVSARSTDTSDISVRMRLNADTGSNYIWKWLRGTGSAANSTGTTSPNFALGYITASDQTTNTFGNAQVYLPNYASAATKSISADVVMENNATLSYQNIMAGSWTTSAITSLEIFGLSGNLAEHSTASLYKITKA